jgi:two-component system, NtrC family, sensor kinase
MERERVKVAQNVSAAIAQEMRNPVFGIASAAQLLRYRVADDPVMEKNIGRILREAERLNTLISALVDYGRPAPVQLHPADPDAVWSDVLARLRGVLESRALLVRHTPAEPRATCNLDPEQFAQACSSVLANAVEGAPEGSDLTIDSVIDNDGAWVSRLRNEGAVIPTETLARAFDPLMSTKLGHAGMGLATAHRIVGDHAGSIALHSDELIGTVLTIVLPPALAAPRP